MGTQKQYQNRNLQGTQKRYHQKVPVGNKKKEKKKQRACWEHENNITTTFLPGKRKQYHNNELTGHTKTIPQQRIYQANGSNITRNLQGTKNQYHNYAPPREHTTMSLPGKRKQYHGNNSVPGRMHTCLGLNHKTSKSYCGNPTN